MNPVRLVLPLQDEAIIHFVKENYNRKIVEVGVGQRLNIAEKLKETMPATEILVTDTQESLIRGYDGSNVRAVVDNVFAPSVQVYEGASLIYALNPPVEMMPALERLAGTVGADLLIRPMSDEQDFFYGNTKWTRVMDHGLPVGWLLVSNGRQPT